MRFKMNVGTRGERLRGAKVGSRDARSYTFRRWNDSTIELLLTST